MTAQILEFSKQGVSVENNYTKIPNWLFDADIEAVERVVLMTIARYTIGYHRRSAKIPMSALCKAAKCSKPRMIKAINALDTKFISVLRTAENGVKSSNSYQLIRYSDDDINSDVVNPVYIIKKTLKKVIKKTLKKKIVQKLKSKALHKNPIVRPLRSRNSHQKQNRLIAKLMGSRKSKHALNQS